MLHGPILKKGYNIFIHEYEPKKEFQNIFRHISDVPAQINLLIIDSDERIYYDEEFQKNIISKNIYLFHITFKHDEHFFSHIIHNQNLLALEHEYSAQDYTKKLLGPEFVILKPQYLKLRCKGLDFRDDVQNLLISFGGADSNNVTFQILKSLCQLKIKSQINVVVGKMYSEINSLNELLKANPKMAIHIFQNTPEMPTLMYHADLAITSGGLTAWELACLGTPNIIISTSIRESLTAELLHRKRLAIYLGHRDQISEIGKSIERILSNSEQRLELFNKSVELVDGNGTKRVIDAISELIQE